MIHTVKRFSIVNEAEVNAFLQFSCLFYDPTDVGNLISIIIKQHILTTKPLMTEVQMTLGQRQWNKIFTEILNYIKGQP